MPGATVERVGEGIEVTFDSGLLYDFDSDVVKPAARAQPGRPGHRASQKYPELGHPHPGPHGQRRHRSLQLDLSVRRADAAARISDVAQDVPRSRIGTGGLGEDEPVASNADDAGRRRNRRVEVAIYASKELQEEAKRKAAS